MGGAGRRTPRLALDRADRLPDGPLDRRAHPQPAVYPGAGLHLLLPQDRTGDVERHRVVNRDLRRADRLRQQLHHPLHRLVRGADRHAVRQHVRPAGQLGHHALRAGADRRPGMGRMDRPQAGPRAAEHHPALDDDDPRRLLVLRLGDDPRRGQPADELQQPQQSARPAVAPEPRPVRRPPAAVRRAVFGSPRGREGEEGVVSGRGRQVQDRYGADGLHPLAGVHDPLPAHVELLERRKGVQAVGRLPHQDRGAARRERRSPPRRAGTPRARRGARFRPQEGLHRLLRRNPHGHGTDVRRKPQLLLQLPALVHVLALFPVEFRGAPERHTAFAHDDHRRQLALGHPLDRRDVPRPAGQPAARNRRKQGPQHLLFPALPAGSDRTAVPAEPRPAELLDRDVVVRDDGYRAGRLFQHLARRAARTRLRLCRLVLRLLDLDRVRRAGHPRPDRLDHQTQQRHGGCRRNRPLHGRSGAFSRPRTGTTTTVRTARWPATSAGTT